MTISIDISTRCGAFTLKAAFSVPSNGITAIVGPSGAGKTSLIRAIAGLDNSKGLIEIDEAVWQNDSITLPTHKRPIGMVFQNPSLFSHLNVRKNLEFASKRATDNRISLSFDEICSITDISHLLNRDTKNLSGGESQRVAIARSLLSGPRIILMDEPVSALDQSLKKSILDLIKNINLKYSIPILYVSHSFEEVALIADHFVHLSQGVVDASSTIVDLFTSPDLPYSKSDDAAFILSGTVEGIVEGYGLTKIRVSGHEFLVQRLDASKGSEVKVLIYAKDLTISRSAPVDSSALNIFPATVVSIFGDNSSTTIVKLSLGSELIISKITRFSADQLKLSKNDIVFVSIKTSQIIH